MAPNRSAVAPPGLILLKADPASHLFLCSLAGRRCQGREELRDAYQQADLNSISTLQAAQPVRRAGESLMPVAGIPYHVISGALPGRVPETDGAVPLASTLLPGASSTLVVDSGHNVYDNDQAIAEVLRVLREGQSQD